MKAMILAAGRGSRMRPLTDTTPKPLLPVNGKPLIVRHIEKLKAIGIQDIVINLAWLGDKIEHYLGTGATWGVNIKYSHEIPGGLETAGGLRHALPLLGEGQFIVVNGDIYTEFDYKRLLDIDLQNKNAHLFLVKNPQHNAKGDFSIGDDGLVNIEPKFTFSGVAVYNTNAIKPIPDEKIPLRIYFDEWIKNKLVQGSILEDFWCDVGTPERLQLVDARLKELENN